MKKFALALVASAFVAAPALADNVSIDSDDNSIYNVLPQAQGTFAGSSFGNSAPVDLGASVNSIDSDDNAIYNVQPVAFAPAAGAGSSFGGFEGGKSAELNSSLNSIDSDDNAIYNLY